MAALASEVSQASKPLSGQGMLFGIQYLRACAAFLVVLFHAQYTFNKMAPAPVHGLNFGAGGVDVFFVISGLIMWVTTCGSHHGPVHFMRNRILRIVPLYWFFTTLNIAIVMIAPHLVSQVLEPLHVVGSYAFLPFPNQATGMRAPILIAGWTLNLELFFYALFAAMLYLSLRWRAWALSGVLVTFVSIGTFIARDSFIGFYTSPLLLEFVAGVLLGSVIAPYARNIRFPRQVWVGLAILGIALLIILPAEEAAGWRRLAYWGIPGFLMVAGAYLYELTGPVRKMSLPKVLGDASYALYLVHPFSIVLAGIIWRRFGFPVDGSYAFAWFAGFASLASLGAGILAHVMIEKPMLAYLKSGRIGALSRARVSNA